jgi:hypothetical protein
MLFLRLFLKKTKKSSFVFDTKKVLVLITLTPLHTKLIFPFPFKGF